ncbi:PTS sugar transporter subunit IIA [Faecalimonas sp.]
MLGSLKEKLGFGKKGEVLYAPIEGEAIELAKVSDPTFGEEILGKGVAILPTVGKVYAPIDGTVEMVFDTKHAISMKSESGIEILIHVGLDTVTLKGEPFAEHVSAGDKVKAGDLLLEFDIEAIKNAGLEVVSPVIICNTADYSEIKTATGKTVGTKDEVMTIIK